MTRLTRDTLTDNAIRAIQQIILQGEVKPGQWLPPQPELAARFGVGLSTIREAVKALTLIGLVNPQPGRGTQVSPNALAILSSSALVRNHLEEIEAITLCEARQIIEVGITALAAERATPADIAAIEGALSRMKASLGDDRAYAAADLDFHLAVARAARNGLLERFYLVSQELLAETTEQLVTLPTVKQRSIEMQEEIVQAIRAGDRVAAYRSAERHMQYLAQLIRTSMKSR